MKNFWPDILMIITCSTAALNEKCKTLIHTLSTIKSENFVTDLL